ncbi:hypothetical protein QVD17_19304 [Tagetes erecta]|uniref:TIR domain-containing protein n=1 Tax=Tagetes erecta TaxID=13708 RepID=A0AAD8NWE4_TARER|nr:hypothetical protein QVD17_19304 [Tagetes erecta]
MICPLSGCLTRHPLLLLSLLYCVLNKFGTTSCMLISMAFTSSSSSTSPPNPIKFDVFLSFRGEDTRHSFTDHLYESLLRAGLYTFRDNDTIDKGQVLAREIKAAINEARAYIIVLSENYANSRWCLDELCLILEQRRKFNHFVLPVFYHVDPSDIRKQRRRFDIDGSKWTPLTKVATLIGISKCLECFGIELERSRWREASMRRWKEALIEVANLTGMVLLGSRSETKFITEVVETVQCKMDLKRLSFPAHLTGMEVRVEVINSWFRNKQYNAIAICGMGGSGKTTLTQYVYNLNKQHFQSSSFIEVTGKQPDGLLGLQKQLLKDVLGGKKIRLSSVSEGTQKIEKVLVMKKALIVLDDIDQHEQLSALLGTRMFPTQSKIIITTRNLDINAWLASIFWTCWVHKVKLLNNFESLELLSYYAFRSKTPMKDFKELAVQLAHYCGGNPLAIKVLGSSLFVNDEDPQTINYMIGIWRSRMNSLNSLRGNIHFKIQGVLRTSFDSLPHPSDRELLLHIACFCVGEYSRHVEMILEDELYAKSGILTLVNRCFLTILPNGKLMMHQLLQEMGRNVVCEESKDPAKRSRVWHDAESYRVLRKGVGSDTIEGLSLDMRNVEQGMRSEAVPLKTSLFANMDRLKLLQLKYVKLSGSYDKFPELIWLCWHGCPLLTMPSGLLMSSLVAIDMSYGHMEVFEAPTVLNSLKILNLKGCDKLVSLRNLYRLHKLNILELWNCSSLTHLCKSIGDLESLSRLGLTGCTKLWKYVNQPGRMMLPDQHLFSLPQSLTWLDLSNSNLEFNNDVSMAFHGQSFFDLHLAANPFKYLPNNIDLKMFRILNLYSCSNLKSLPCIPSTLEELYIDWCTSLERVTFQSGRFSLRVCSYECCFKLFEIQGLFKLVPIAKINAADMGHLQWIKSYEDHKVDLVGDDITKGNVWHTQMLYEFGIVSTYLQGIKDQILLTYKHTSSSNRLSFCVPYQNEKNRIRGLDVSFLYRSSGSKDKDAWNLWAKVSNISKGITWVYNPVVYCKPKGDEDVVWISYWPIGNILDDGDEVSVDIYVEEGMIIVCGCGASIAYMDSEVDEIDKCENEEEEVIGGDLSEFEVNTGCYYLCRRDAFGLETSYWLKKFFGDDFHYTDSQGWRKTHQSVRSRELRDYASTFHRIIEVGVSLNSESEIGKIEKEVSSLAGVESVSSHKEIGKLIVTGYVDPVEVATCVRQFDNMLSFKIIFE